MFSLAVSIGELKMAMVVLESKQEILVCEQEYEETLKKEYFAKGSGRDLDDYDRIVCEQGLAIRPFVRPNFDKIISESDNI